MDALDFWSLYVGGLTVAAIGLSVVAVRHWRIANKIRRKLYDRD